MHRVHVFLWLCLLLPHLVDCLSVDGVALITFKNYLVADPHSALANWNVSDDIPCSWNGVVCTNVRGSSVPRVIGLSLVGKNLSGAIAPALGALDAIHRLNLHDNNLTGRIPAQLFNATSLQTILLGGNHLTGWLPQEIGRLVRLQTFDISDNALSGSIPHSITKCTNLQTLVLSKNLLAGSIPVGFGGRLNSLEQIDLSSNHLSGLIPDDLGKLSSLVGTLNLSNNRLSGHIPATLGDLPYVVSIDLSHNNLSGKIPQNGLLGEQGPGAFLGNPKLCGLPLTVICHIAPPLPSLPVESSPSLSSRPNADSDSRKSGLSAAAIVGIAVGDALGVTLVAFLLMYWYSRSRMCHDKVVSPSALTAILSKKKHGTSKQCFYLGSEVSSDASGSPEKSEEQGGLVALDKGFSSDLDELLRSSAYVLGQSGQGIVYKVVLGSGTAVAVRRLGEGGNQKPKEFESEVQAISKVRHPNLVRLLAYYWAADEKLLIFEYIPHGTLESALQGSRDIALTWAERLGILHGAAKGIAHIHDCSPRKHVHGDVRASKILLGPAPQAYVADFGVIKLTAMATDSNNEGHEESADWPEKPREGFSSRHYIAPELLTGGPTNKASQKGDVYSFGVVIMEAVSGRTIYSRRHAPQTVDLVTGFRNIGGAVETLVDPTLGASACGISNLVDLAIQCVAPSPDLRPRMKDVAEATKKLAKAV